MSFFDALLRLLSRDLLVLLGAGCGAALIAALLAPLGPLSWWAGWMQRPTGVIAPPDPQRANAASAHYLVYLSGIGEIDAVDLGDLELGYLRRLAAQLPSCVIIHDIFTYAVDNVGLTEEHWLGGFWRWVRQSRTAHGRIAILGELVNLRNVIQVLVAADPRYGPIYSWGVAEVIARSLTAHGYQYGSGTPVTLIGYSGGAQIALGVARYLGPALGGPLHVITVGGVMNADPGIDAVETITQLSGTGDRMPTYGVRCFPGRWPIVRNSPWNRAYAAGKITPVAVGPAGHHGRGGYFDPAVHADGRSLLDATVDATVRRVNAISAGPGAATPHHVCDSALVYAQGVHHDT
jgi:hypothetical protein